LPVFLNRVLFHDPMPIKLLPTLFILIAPASVGFISYMRADRQPGPLRASVLFYFGVFTFLMLTTMLPEVPQSSLLHVLVGLHLSPGRPDPQSFFLMHKVTGQDCCSSRSPPGLLALTTLVVLLVLVRTIGLAARGGLCVAED
jgi:tellurite resistance protein